MNNKVIGKKFRGKKNKSYKLWVSVGRNIVLMYYAFLRNFFKKNPKA